MGLPFEKAYPKLSCVANICWIGIYPNVVIESLS